MAASADSSELSSDGQSAPPPPPPACDLVDVCSTDDVLDSESRRPVDRHGDEFNLAESPFVFWTGVDVLERRAGVDDGDA